MSASRGRAAYVILCLPTPLSTFCGGVKGAVEASAGWLPYLRLCRGHFARPPADPSPEASGWTQLLRGAGAHG